MCASIATAAYLSPAIPKQKTVLLIHGITGDRHGAVPLGLELTKYARVVLVEIPGHGNTEVPVSTDPKVLQQWSAELIDTLATQGITIDAVVAHSFGCYVAQFLQPRPTLFFNPAVRISPAVLRFLVKLRILSFIVRHCYGWSPWATYRGYRLLYRRTLGAIAAVRWISKATTISPEQFDYMEKISIRTDNGLLNSDRLKQFSGAGVVIGDHDRVALATNESVAKVFDEPRIYHLAAGHLSIIEMPKESSEIVRKHFDL